jgi:hypothetical protein
MTRFSRSAMVSARSHAVSMSLAVAAPTPALAQISRAEAALSEAAPDADVVYLESGAVLRGTVIDARPDVHVRIRLGTGEIVALLWRDVTHIELAPRESRPPSPGSAGPSVVEGREQEVEDVVWVHIEGSDVAQLQRDVGDRHHWETMCSAPCDEAFSVRYRYRIAGKGINDSVSFSLNHQAGGRVRLTVNEVARIWVNLGITGVSAGGAALMFGAIFAALGAAVDEGSGIGRLQATGLALAGVGLAGVVGGIVLIARNARSGVAQTPLTGSQSSASNPSITWQAARLALDPGDRREAPAPPTLSVPLFGATF